MTMRDEIFANQKKLGVIPANAKLTDWPDSLPKWDSLSADQKKLFARQAEVYAGYTAYTDNEIGRVIQQVEDMVRHRVKERDARPHRARKFDGLSDDLD